MPRNLSSEDVAWILGQVGITLRRRGKEDVYSGQSSGQNRVVIVPRNKRTYSCRNTEFNLAASRDNE